MVFGREARQHPKSGAPPARRWGRSESRYTLQFFSSHNLSPVTTLAMIFLQEFLLARKKTCTLRRKVFFISQNVLLLHRSQICFSMSASPATSSWLCRQLFRSHCELLIMWSPCKLEPQVEENFSIPHLQLVHLLTMLRSWVCQLVSLQFSLTWWAWGRKNE